MDFVPYTPQLWDFVLLPALLAFSSDVSCARAASFFGGTGGYGVHLLSVV